MSNRENLHGIMKLKIYKMFVIYTTGYKIPTQGSPNLFLQITVKKKIQNQYRKHFVSV